MCKDGLYTSTAQKSIIKGQEKIKSQNDYESRMVSQCDMVFGVTGPSIVKQEKTVEQFREQEGRNGRDNEQKSKNTLCLREEKSKVFKANFSVPEDKKVQDSR